MSYTKEEWKVEDTTIYALEFDSWYHGQERMRNRFCAQVYGFRDTPEEEIEANARLMAAAPELLEALQLAKQGIEAHIEYARGKDDYKLFTVSVLSLQTIETAIKKALGE